MANGNGAADEGGWITIEELLMRIDAAVCGMGTQNPNRVMLMQCRAAIIFLAEKVPDDRLRYAEVHKA